MTDQDRPSPTAGQDGPQSRHQDNDAAAAEQKKNPPTDRLKVISQWRPWEPSEPGPTVLESIDAHGAPPEDHGPTPVAPPAESAQIGLEHFTDPRRRRVRAIARKIFFNGLVDRTIRRRVERKPGAETLSGACVVVANHSSHLDAPLIMSSLPVNLRQNVATGVAADYFFTTWYKKLFTQLVFNAFPIDRKGAGENRGLSRKLLSAGIPVLVFPEGTRSKDGRMRDFKVGAAALASSIKVPVLPVALIGAHEAMPRDTSWPRRGRPRVVVAIGEPLAVRENETTVAFNERIQATVRSLYREYRPLIDQ